jgi:hypothetical protein
MIDTLKKLLPWLSELPIPTKVVVSLIILLLAIFLLLVIWLPAAKGNESNADKNEEVINSYERMQRVLSRLTISKRGLRLVDGEPIDDKLIEYYEDYFNLQSYIKEHPKDIKGAYEKIWELGGESRTFINHTNAFEAVVSSFFRTYEEAKKKTELRPT